jgi:hypothetical protein
VGVADAEGIVLVLERTLETVAEAELGEILEEVELGEAVEEVTAMIVRPGKNW